MLLLLDFYDFEARVVCHEVEHLNGRDMMHWAVSEGSVWIDNDFEDQYEAFNKEIGNYEDKINEIKREDPTAFKRKMQIKYQFEKSGKKWNQLSKGYTEPQLFSNNTEKFNAKFAIDMYKAAQKDKRKKELKKKFMSGSKD